MRREERGERGARKKRGEILNSSKEKINLPSHLHKDRVQSLAQS
jgi:hypothetical protein